MDEITNNKTLLILFGNKENFTFVVNQIVPKFDEIINQDILYCNKNTNPIVRANNYKLIINQVKDFLKNNHFFDEFLKNFSSHPIESVIDAYVFIKIKSREIQFNKSVFTDEKSVIYKGFDPSLL